MWNHDQQPLTKAQLHWLTFATDPDESMTTVKHLATVLKMALYFEDIQKVDKEALDWVFYLLECATHTTEDHILQSIGFQRGIKEKE